MGLRLPRRPAARASVDLLEGNYDCAGVHGAPKLHPARARRGAARCAADFPADECGCVEGDFIRLWTRLELGKGGPLELLYTLILYAMTATLALLALYSYAVRVHMNGRMMDTYRRIHGAAESFFVPRLRDEPRRAQRHRRARSAGAARSARNAASS